MTRPDARPRRPRRAYAARVPAQQRRAQLLDAALRLVATQGHHAVTMEAVAEQVGVTKPVIYDHFRSRADLLAALLHREHDGALQQLLATLPAGRPLSGADPAELAIQVLSGFLQAVQDSPDRWHCIVMPMPDMPTEFHAAREQARTIVLRQAQRIAARLFGGQRTDAELAAHAVVTLFEMAARLLLTDPDRFTPDRFVTALRATVSLTRPP
jgi:AcrR family transcriptional regulator